MVSVRWQSAVDFLVLAAAFYLLLLWARQARAVRIALGIVALHTGALVARDYDLVITSWVLSAAGFIAIAVLLVVFPSELRRALMRVDRFLRLGPHRLAILQPAYRAISEAAFSLAGARVGALIVVVRQDSVAELIDGGIVLGADISGPLLEAVFQKTSPLHDGAVIVEENRVARANAVLPLTQRAEVPGVFGTRHRAALGLAERCDALVVAVSEERGEVTLMQGRGWRRVSDEQELFHLLGKLQSRPKASLPDRLRRMAFLRLQFKLAAVGLAGLVWAASFLGAGTSVRVVTAPVEFSNVPGGMEIAGQSATTLALQLRGNRWIMDSAGVTRLAAHFDLGGAHEGKMTLRVEPEDLNLPPGIVMEKATPEAVSVRLVRRAAGGRAQ